MDRDRAIEILRDMALPETGYELEQSKALKAGADALVRLHSIEQEIAEARREIEALRIKPWQEQIEAQAAEISKLRYERDEARKDAARWAFYRTNSKTHEMVHRRRGYAYKLQFTNYEYDLYDSVDAAIDAAMERAR
jgi:hypothetical protein